MPFRPKSRLQAAMKAALVMGFDPYNSHQLQARVWSRKQTDYMRKRQEYWAKKLPALLSPQAE